MQRPYATCEVVTGDQQVYNKMEIFIYLPLCGINWRGVNNPRFGVVSFDHTATHYQIFVDNFFTQL